jgi:hypothetical protein
MHTTPDDFEAPGGDELVSFLPEAESAWGASDVEECGRAREEAWATWPAERCPDELL